MIKKTVVNTLKDMLGLREPLYKSHRTICIHGQCSTRGLKIHTTQQQALHTMMIQVSRTIYIFHVSYIFEFE